MSSFKDLLRAKSARIVVPVFLSVFIALAAGISFSCSFLEDDGFFDKIEGEVSVANADKMNVYIRYASIKFGKTTPADAALYQVKNNVSFSVTAITNSEYAFYRWAAFSTKDFDVAKQHMNLVYSNDDDYYANFGGNELDASVVKFENPRAETTNVTVLQTRDDIWIMPVVAVRPTIAGTFPGTAQTPVRNTKLRVQFSKPMDIESFEGNFIISQATRAADFSLNEVDITDKFEKEINEKGNLVTFSFKNTSEMFNPAVIVRLYFTDDIADSTGYTMAESNTLSWNIGTYVDNLPPLITEMTAGIGNDCSKFASTPTRLARTATDDLSNSLYTSELLSHRVKDKVNLYVYAQDIAQANGERMESDVLMLGFRAKSIIDLEGKAIDSSIEGNFIPNNIVTYAAGQNMSDINGSFRAITGKSAGYLYTYDLSSLPDGLIQIEVYAVDSTGNDGDTGYDPSIDDEEGMGNGPRSIFVVKDNKAPAIENEVDKIKSSSIAAPYGWYNKLTIDTVEIYDTAANPICDFGHQKLGAAHENLKWVCNIGTSTDWQVPANDARWVPVSERYKIGSASIDNDGAVSVTIRLMDDLGNISEAKQITSVLCDNTVPDAGNMFCVDASGNQCLNSTKETVVPDSMLIRLPFTEDLSGVKVVGLNIKASDGTKVENAFENASILYSAKGAPSAAEPVAIEPDTSSLKALLDSEGYAKSPIFTDGLDCLHVLGASYHTGIFYIKNLTLGTDDGMYTVTITLYDAALNKAAEKSVMLAHDTKSPVVDRVYIQNVVPRKVYNENETTYWLPRSAYDDKKDAKYVSVSVTATENGSGVKVVTIGENAHITEDTTFSIEGTPVAEGRCSIDPKTNTVVFSDYNNPDIYKQTGSVSFVLTNIRLDNPNSADGNKVSVSLKDFVDNTGINENAGNFDLYIDDTSDTKIYKVFSDSMAPGIDAKTPPALADGKADSASDETKYSAARLALEYTDTKNVDLSLTLSAQATGSGVRSLALTNGLFTADTNISVDGKPLAITEYTLDGPIVTFVNSVFTAENTLKFTNVELQGAEDGPQSISITATNFTGWVSNASATKAIVLDRAAPVVDDVRWNLKEGVYGVSKAAVVSNMDLCVTFTEVMTGVKVLGIDPKLNDVSATETPFESANFAIKYLSQTEAEAQTSASTEETEEGKEVKPIEKDPLALIGSAKLLKADEDYTISGNYITFKNPQNFKSGLFVLENLKVADNFEDNKSYKINVHLSDAALNGTAKDGQADLASDSTAPQIKRIFINRLIARTQAGAQDVDSWWISKEDFEQAGKVPTKIDVELTINESGSGVETVVLGENLRLTKDSVITCGTTTLVKDKDYKVSSDFATITLITKSSPKFRNENNDFIVKISNATLTSEGENKVSVTLKDFALNSDENSKLSKIALPESGKEPVESVFVDFTAPLLAEGGVKIVDRGGSPELDGTADKDANTVALDGFTNEKLVNITVKTASSEDGSAKRSGVKQLVLSGAKYSSSSKFYYKNAASNSEDFAEITNVDTGDGVTATFKNSYACENVCEFIITNVELTGAEGENTVSVYPVDLVGWSDSEKAVNDKITLDMTPPNWGNNAVVMGTIGENGNDADYVWPKTPGARILASDGEVYFYKRPQGTESEPIYLTVNASDTNFYGLYFVSDASDKTSGAVAIAAKESNKAILTKITDVKFDASSNHEYTIVLKDRAGNISTETKSVHVVKDGEAEIVNDDDESSSLQNNMEYKESRENYHIFKTSVPKTLTREESDGVDGVSGVSGYAVYYNDGNGGKDGVNPVTIEVNLANHKENSFKINSGVAYYAINGSAQAPAATLEGEYTAPTSALQNWNKWIPFTSGTTKLTLYPKNDGKNPLNMRLWFKDNVGNVQSVEIKQKTEAGLQAEPDIWICDNTIPQNANGTTDGFVPENSQLSENGLDFGYMMPDHMWKVGSSASSAVLKVMYAAGLESEKEKGKTDNRIFFSDNAKASFVINNEPSETVAIESGNADSDNWAVRLFLYPSNSATTPSREVVMSWIKEDANKNKYFYGIPSGSTITLSNIEYPKECSETTPYIYVVAEDRVGNINISKLNVKINAAEYSTSSSTTATAKDYWYGKFIYDKESPEVYLGGTGGANGSRVNFENYSSAEDIAKLVPYNDGRRASVTTPGTTWISTSTYGNSAKADSGINTKHDYSAKSTTKYQLFFNIDVDSFAPYAYYYSHSENPASASDIYGKIGGYNSNYSKWVILDGTGIVHEGKIPTIIDNNTNMTSSSDSTYLHVADKLGRVKTVKMGNTKYQVDNTPPTVNFGSETTGLHINDNADLYRIDAVGAKKLAITFSSNAKKRIDDGTTVNVYIPTEYITESGSGLYGYSWKEYLTDGLGADCKDENGYYLKFESGTENADGSYAIKSTSKVFYVFDKVGNKTPISITASVDDKPPELTMSFSAAMENSFVAAYPSVVKTDYTTGKIYDASTTSATKDIDCSNSESALSTASPFIGADSDTSPKDVLGYKTNKPYTIFSNARSSATGTYGYILGTFIAKDQNGNDTTDYNGILTEIIVKTHTVTSTDSGDSLTKVDWDNKTPITLPYSLADGTLTKNADNSYTLPMTIFLDAPGDVPSPSVSSDFKGKLYQITVKDSGGNATTVYLKVMRDRDAPTFGTKKPKVIGGIGEYNNYFFYNPASACVDPDSLSEFGDSGVGCESSYPILKYIYSSSSTNTTGSSSNVSSLDYVLNRTSTGYYGYYLYATDYLGNENLIELGDTKIGEILYVGNTATITSTRNCNFVVDDMKPEFAKPEGTISSYGRFVIDDSTKGTLYYNPDKEDERYPGKNVEFTVTVKAEDKTGHNTTTQTTHRNVVKGFYVSKTELELDTPAKQVAKADEITLLSGSVSSYVNTLAIKIKPSDYLTAGSKTGKIYIYAVDYAKNFSKPFVLSFAENEAYPNYGPIKVEGYKKVGSNIYFNNKTKVSFTINDPNASIWYYGLFDTLSNDYYDKSIANTQKKASKASDYPAGTTYKFDIDFSEYGNGPLDNNNTFDGIFVMVRNWNGKGRYSYLPGGTKLPWTYDDSANLPSSVSVNADSENVAFKSNKAGEKNKIYYSKNVYVSDDDRTFYVDVKFPADPSEIEGYKIQIGDDGTLSGKLSFSETGYSVDETTRKIPIAVPSGTGDTTVKIYAVDGLGNVSSPYSFTISKISNAPTVTDISIDEEDVIVNEGARRIVKEDRTIYVNRDATSITVKPVYGYDITGIVGFALSEDGLDFTDIVSSVTDADNKTFTITFGAELPSDANGSKEYKVYAKNGIGLYSESGYPLTIVRDVTGPKVTSITLSAKDDTNPAVSGKLNYNEKLYYNESQSCIKNVNTTDIIDSFAGVGRDDTGYFAVTTETPATAPAANAKLGNLNAKSSSEVYIALIDKLGNVGYTKFSEIDITIPAASCISGSEVLVNKKNFTFVYDETRPNAVTGITLPAGKEGNGLHFDSENNVLYYNTGKLGGATSLELTPVQKDGKDENHYGFRTSDEPTPRNTITISPLSKENITIYAVDKAGNDSETGYELKLKAVNAPSITDLSKDSDNKHVITITGAADKNFNEVTGSDGYPVININSKVETITVIPVVSEELGEDVSVMKGFASSTSEEPAAANTNSYTITVDLAEAAKDGGQVCKIYAVNKLGLRSENPYKITVVLDNKGPVVSEITLTASEGKYINYYGEGTTKSLYYNDSAATVTVDKVDSDTDGKYAITDTNAPETAPELKETLKLGDLTGSSTGLFIAAKDKLGNPSYTPLSKIKIKIPATSTKNIAEGETEVVIHDESSSTVSFTVTYDGRKPKNVTKVTLPTGKEGNGLHFDSENNVLYYNIETLGATTLKLTPVQEEGKDTNHYGFIVDGTLKTDADVTVDFSANPETLKIIAEDLAGNVSDEYTLTLKAVNKPSITGLILKEGSETEHKIDIEGDDGKDFNEVTKSESKLVININDKVKTITVTPVVNQGSGISVMKGFASSASEEPADGNTNTYTITVDKIEAEKTDGQVCTIYAVNKLGLRSENPYTITVFLDTTGPVVSEITLTASDTGKYINYYGEGTDKFLYYNDKDAVVTIAENGVDSDTDGKYAITDTNAPETAPELKETLKLGDLTGSSTGLYIAAKDKLGNPSYTPLNKIKINIPKASTINIAADKDKVEIPASTDSAPLTFTVKYDGDVPGCPLNIDAPADKVGKGMWKSEHGTDIGTMYYNTDLLKEADSTIPDGTIYLKVTFPSDNTGIVGYKLQYNPTTDPISETNLFGTAIPAGATGDDSVRDIPVVITSNTLVRVFAVDMAGNVKIDDEDTSANYVIFLTKDDKAVAEKITQKTGNYDGKIFIANGPGGTTTYYKSGLEVIVNLKASGSPIIAYALVANGTEAPDSSDTAWKSILVQASADGNSKEVGLSFGEIKTLKTGYALWVKDAVGNIQAYSNKENKKDRGNALGNPSSQTNLSSTYWHLYDITTEVSVENSISAQTLTISKISDNFPVKSLKFTGLTLGAGGMKIDGKVKLYWSGSEAAYKEIDVSDKNISNTDGAYTLELGDSYIMNKLEFTFDKGAFYFGDDAKVVVTTGFKTGDENDTVTIGLSKTLPTTYYYTYDSENKSLKFTGLLSKYNMNHFYIEGISFSDNNPDGKVDSVKVGETDATNYQFRKDGDKYDIQFNDNPGPSADSLTINFKVEPTLTDTLTISVQRWDLTNAVTLTAIKSDPEPDTSIFGGLLTRVSSSISSIFSGRSMTHEELEALKEAKAEKARARAAEKAAKKAAKKAARDAKKNAEIASASPNQGESWTGLSGEFESASSELDSALAKMKDSSGPEAKASDEVSSKNGIIKVKSGKKNAVSNSKELITDSTVRKTENHGNRMIYVFGFLAVLGVISGIFAKKVRKNSKKS